VLVKRVTGIGGVFFKSKDPKALGEWYRQHLGFNVEEWGGVAFRWVTPDNPTGTGTTVWNPFKEDTSYFAPSTARFMSTSVSMIFMLFSQHCEPKAATSTRKSTSLNTGSSAGSKTQKATA
jgi:hypothetical protein